MKDDEHSYLSLSALSKGKDNSYKWSRYYSGGSPKHDGLIFVKIEPSPN